MTEKKETSEIIKSTGILDSSESLVSDKINKITEKITEYIGCYLL